VQPEDGSEMLTRDYFTKVPTYLEHLLCDLNVVVLCDVRTTTKN
jgi:hypothetical protein